MESRQQKTKVAVRICEVRGNNLIPDLTQFIQIHVELEVAVHNTQIDQKYYDLLVKPSNHI